MLYLVHATHELKWNDMPAGTTLALAKENPDADLARLEWQEPDTYTLTLDDVRLALRHGHPCSTGIVVDAWPLLAQRRPDDLQSTAMRSAEAQRRVRDSPAARLMERVAPGWTQHGEELDAEIDASTLREVRKAEAEARSFFDAPVNDDLVAHWTRLGGQLPDPL